MTVPVATTLEALNLLDAEAAAEAFRRCCGSERWAQGMVAARPYADAAALYEAADRIWAGLTREDWLEAFAQHPRIGDLDSLKAKYANTKLWAKGEQAGAEGASMEVLQALSTGNQQYEARFGYLFIVCATGKRADEMLAILKERLPNDPDREVRLAAEEQRKITRIRLEKLITA